MRRCCILSFLFFIGFLQYSIAQNFEDIPKDMKFKHFTSTDGLSQISVIAILQDKKGYLWLGTRDGLNKFDGKKFIVYKHKIGDTKSLSNNSIHSIYEDSYGNIWIGTQNGLSKYNPQQDNFVQYKYTDHQHNAKGYIIWGIVQVSQDILWVATDNGITQINIKTNKIGRIQDHKINSRLSVDNQIRYFLKSKDGSIWICRTKYIEIYDPEEKTSKRISYPKNNNGNIPLNNISTLYLDQKNALWLGYEQGLALYDPLTESFIDFEFQNKKAITTPVRSICEDLLGNLWIGTYSGLYLLNQEHSDLRHIAHDETISTSLSQNSIHKIIRDSRGDMWLGTYAGGINYYNRDNGTFKTIFSGNTDNKLNYQVVSGIVEDSDGNLWIGTEGGGLNFYNRETKKFTYYKNNPYDKNSLSANNVKTVIFDRKGNLWIGLHDGGLNFLNPNKKPFKFEKIDFPKTNNFPLRGYRVQSLLEDKNGNIWVGTSTGGLIFYDTHKKLLSKIDKDIRMVISIVQTENPNLLLTGGSHGLEVINIQTKKRRKIKIKDTSEKELPLFVNCIFIDTYNNYWIGTEGQGVYVYNPKKKTTKVYRTKEGLPNDIVYGILSDNMGNIWISTNNGISRLEISSNTIKNYTQSDGLQGNEFNYGSFLKTKSKELFFGGTNGLSYFNPNDIRKNTFLPAIDIYNMDVNNASFSKIIDSLSEIILKHNDNNFSIDFTALSYMRPEKNEFAYILEGNDKDWNYVGNQRKAVYTNIKEGNYIFKVKGANNDGVWNEEGDFITIKVLPAPWRTWWAYLLYLAFLAGVFLYIKKLILLRIKERKEKEKSEQINELRLRLFTDVSHDFRTPLTLIVGPLEKMIRENLGDSYIRHQHGIMLKNSRMLLQLVNQILDFRKSESGHLTLQASKSNIIPFVEDIKKSFDALADKKNIDYQLISGSENIQVWFDKIKLKEILFNLLSNAFKFSNDHSKVIINVSISSKKTDAKLANHVKISVVNFDYVIPEEHINLIFDQFYQIDNKKKGLGSGIGLSLTKRLVELHKGKITVESSETKGTCFMVLLRLGNEHLSKNECINDAESIEDDNFFYVDIESTDAQQVGDSGSISNITPYKNDLQSLLVVEDNLDLQNFIKEIFIDKYNIFVAENGEHAINIAHQNPIDLIISDIQMPVMDGFELCHNIKTTLLTSHIPVILLTAKTSPIHQEKGYNIGADAYITKPFNAKILEVRVNNLLETRTNLIRKFKKEAILEPKKLTVTSPDEIFLEKAISIVEQNITNPDFNTGMLIDQMNMSRTVIYTKLKALTGQNASTFIRTIRLKKAGQLITLTKMNISQIAYEVGFNDLKYFRECFKDFFKVTPSEYKKRNSEENKPLA